jgi:hypothetical protein
MDRRSPLLIEVRRLMRLRKRFAVTLIFELLSSAVLTNGIAAASGQLVAPVSYKWWRSATPARRIDAIGAAIQGIRAGWVFGVDANRGDVQANLIAAKSTANEMDIALRPRRRAMPTYLKPLAVYASKIESAYAANPAMRGNDIALVLLCFSDVRVRDCVDARGLLLR